MERQRQAQRHPPSRTSGPRHARGRSVDPVLSVGADRAAAVESHARDIREGRTTIAIVDDHPDLRNLLSLRFGLVPGLTVVGQAGSSTEAIALARKLAPDVMTLDLRMPGLTGLDAIPLLRAAAPRMRIVLFSSESGTIDVGEDGRPDASVSKAATLQDLVDAVVNVVAEKRTFAPAGGGGQEALWA